MSVISGEDTPQKCKSTSCVEGSVNSILEAPNLLFCGSVLLKGTGKAVVFKTGDCILMKTFLQKTRRQQNLRKKKRLPFFSVFAIKMFSDSKNGRLPRNEDNTVFLKFCFGKNKKSKNNKQ